MGRPGRTTARDRLVWERATLNHGDLLEGVRDDAGRTESGDTAIDHVDASADALHCVRLRSDRVPRASS